MENLKLIILTNQRTYLVGKLQELDEEPSILLEDVYAIDNDGHLTAYPLHTDQRYLFLTSEQVFTILDPSTVVVDEYKKKMT